MSEQAPFSYQHLAVALEPHRDTKRWLVAVSGGLDSTVLLHALTAWRQAGPWPGPELLAVHVDHGLSPAAENWRQHCENLCRQWEVSLVVETVVVKPEGKGVEAAARAERYRAIAAHLQPGDVLLTAHHRDDQAETLFLRLLRGAGTRGLAAMALDRKLGKSSIVRPLLDVSRAQLASYAEQHRLRYCQDESNSEAHFDRNFLRHEILPRLQTRWPDLARRWSRTARILAENEAALVELAAMDLRNCAEEGTRLGRRLDGECFLALSISRRNNLLRHWCRQHHLPLPEYRHLWELADLPAVDPEPAAIAVQWSGTSLRGFKHYLYLLPAAVLDRAVDEWPILSLPADANNIALPDGGQLSWRTTNGGLRPDLGPLIVRWRRGGERCRPPFRQHSQTLKKCLQEIGLEPWLRDRVPLIYAGDTLVAVADLWVCEGFAVPEKESGIGLRWRYDQDPR